ncbi:MAG: 2,3,4,5-tetrahydropyridine-2,6-dicarboxylate N-succinyltransferase, partial [Caulobacteraceae bacterium]
MSDLQSTIEAAWDARAEVNFGTKGAVRDAVEAALALLDSGQARVAEKTGNDWTVHQWLKKAVLLSFRLNPNAVMGADTGGVGPWFDKVPTKFDGWGAAEFQAAGFRAVPGAMARKGAFIGRNAILMPSFVNIGAYVDEGTMVDSWSTVGSCAQIGKNV